MKKNNRIAALIALVTIIVFAPCLANKFVYDDAYFITENHNIRRLANIPSFFVSFSSFAPKGTFYIYRPLSTLTYALDYWAGRLNPLIFHADSVIWHAAVSVLLYFTLNAMLKNGLVSLVSSLLFAVHPVQTESVAWVSQRSNLISLFFFLLAFYLWIKDSSAGSLLCYALALAGKEVAITLPMIIILHDMYMRKAARGRIRYYMPFFIVSVLYLILRTAVLGRISGQDMWAGGSICTAVMTGLKTVPFYVRMLLLPFGLCVDHKFTPAKSLLEPVVILSLLFVIAAILVGVLLARKRREEGFFIIWGLVTLLPVSNIVPMQGVVVADRFLYFPSIGFCALLSMLIMRTKKSRGILAAGLAIFYGCLAVSRNMEWRDDARLWTVTVKQNPGSERAHFNLGIACAHSGRYLEAIESLTRAIAINPAYQQAYYNLGVAYADLGRYDEAVWALNEALYLKPGDWPARYNLGWTYVKTGRKDSALEQYAILKNRDENLARELFDLIEK